MLTHKAQWLHRRRSPFLFCNNYLEKQVPWCWGRWQHRAHCVGGGWICQYLCHQNLLCAQNGVHCAHLLEGLRLTNGKRSLSPAPTLRFAVQIYRCGYKADLWHSGSSCPVLLKQKLLYCTLKAGTQRNKAAWKTSLRGGVWAPFKVKNPWKTKHFRLRNGLSCLCVHTYAYSSEHFIQTFVTKASDLSLLSEAKRGVAGEEGQKGRNSKLAR